MSAGLIDLARYLKKKSLKMRNHGVKINKNVVVNDEYDHVSKGVLIVTAFYPIKSKHSLSQYNLWIRNFFSAIQEKKLIYTDKAGLAILKKIIDQLGRTDDIGDEIIFIEKPFYSFVTNMIISASRKFVGGECLNKHISNKKFLIEFWRKQNLLDPEYHLHTPELYLIWHEKCHFCMQAAGYAKNAEWIIWMDIGLIRDYETFNLIKSRSINIHKMPKKDRVLGLAINDPEAVFLPNTEKLLSIRNNIIGGGVFCGNKNAWAAFTHLFIESTIELLTSDENIFIGKDQQIYNLMYYNNRDIFELIKIETDEPDEKKDWFALLKYLYN